MCRHIYHFNEIGSDVEKMHCQTDRFCLGSVAAEGCSSHETPESIKYPLESRIPDWKIQLRLTTQHVPGVEKMADFASCSFEQHTTAEEFLTIFHTHFPPTTEQVLDLLPPTTKDNWMCHLHGVNADIKAGVMVLTQATRDHYWQHWCNFLHQISIPTFKNWMHHNNLWSCKSLIFAWWVWVGAYRWGKQVKPLVSRQPLGPLPRQLSWLDTPTCYKNLAQPTTMLP